MAAWVAALHAIWAGDRELASAHLTKALQAMRELNQVHSCTIREALGARNRQALTSCSASSAPASVASRRRRCDQRLPLAFTLQMGAEPASLRPVLVAAVYCNMSQCCVPASWLAHQSTWLQPPACSPGLAGT